MAKIKQGRKLVVFEATAKNADELLDKKNMTNAAIFYRVIVAADKPLTRAAIYKASESKCESGAAWERLGHQTHDTLARLRKAGFVKRTETREAVNAESSKRIQKNSAQTKKRSTPRKQRTSKRSETREQVAIDVAQQAEATA